jgi:uncharacterized protein (TIGR02594 family)
MNTSTIEPKWLPIARSYYGIREIKGPKTNPVISGWLKMLNAWYSDDESPWCGVFVGAVFHKLGYKIPKLYMRAKAWLDWGQQVPVCVGAVGVKSRVGGGHVTFIVGRTKEGKLVGLGGNQGDAVSYATFDPKVFEGFRYPSGVPLPLIVGMNSLPIMEVVSNGPVSEA